VTPEAYCADKAARIGSTPYYSYRFLAAGKRHALTALRAFCRELSDVVRDCSDPGLARATLSWWRSEIADTFAGRPQHPVGKALLPAIRDAHLPEQELRAVIDGVESDVDRTRLPDFESLRRYRYRVDGVMERLSAAVLGYSDEATLDYAGELGVCVGLTRVLRDVGKDAHRGRIYLPLDELARFGVEPLDILDRRQTDAFRQLMLFQAARLKQRYVTALSLLPAADRASQRPGLAMAAIYQALLREMERDGFPVLTHSMSLTPIRKLYLAWSTWIRG
jgi:15-cis-phytoene synthase